MKTSLYKLSIYLILAAFASGLSPSTMAQSFETEPQLSLQQKVGQIFIFGYPSDTLTPAGTRLLSQVLPGGLIAFGRHIKNLEQIGKLNQDLQKLSLEKSGVPTLLMVDQEGGTVSRIHLSMPLPSALALGKVRDDALIENYGEVTGELLRSLGFQMNLAPVLDLSDPNSRTFIGNRSFGGDARAVSHLTTFYARGLAKAGIIPTAKHFPGHGGVSQDSHLTTPRKFSTIKELQDSDLKPFHEFEKIPFAKAVMLGHVSLPNADPSNMPAAFSHYILNDLLRGKVGFTGLAITDDVEMSGAAVAGSLGERVVKAFEAGNDMIMVAGSPASQLLAYNSLLKAVQTGRISQARLESSVQRILAAKAHIKPFSFSKTLALSSAKKLSLLAEAVTEKNFDSAAEPFDALRGYYNHNQKYLIFTSDTRFYSSFQDKIPRNTRLVRLTPQTLDSVNVLLRQNPSSIAVYYASGLATARWLSGISASDKSRLIVINTNHAAAVENQAQFKAVFNVNTPAPESGAWLADFLSFKPNTLPDDQAALIKPLPVE
jgi:beta-N-acetylhexosaminidase